MRPWEFCTATSFPPRSPAGPPSSAACSPLMCVHTSLGDCVGAGGGTHQTSGPQELLSHLRPFIAPFIAPSQHLQQDRHRGRHTRDDEGKCQIWGWNPPPRAPFPYYFSQTVDNMCALLTILQDNDQPLLLGRGEVLGGAPGESHHHHRACTTLDDTY
jgi:hypothetical protein